MRTFFATLISLIVSLSIQAQDAPPRKTLNLPNGRAAEIPAGPFEASWESLQENYRTPQWFIDGKFGIFIHWGVYSVPAAGSEWYPRHMYGAMLEHHKEHWGNPKDFGYKDFIPLFKAEKFDAAEWAALFKEAGAAYVIPTAEHHDGFAMYDSRLTRWNAKQMGPKRDVIGELSKAVRAEGMKFGVSNHRIEHWDFMWPTKAKEHDLFDPEYADFYGPPQKPDDTKASAMGPTDEEVMEGKEAPQSQAFLEEWLARCQEIIDNYQPDMLWFDNGINSRSLDSIKLRLAAYYYNRAAEWGKPVSLSTKHDAYLAGTITDYERMSRAPKERTAHYWQVDDPIGHKFGYVEGLRLQSADGIVRSLVNNISRNGNLCLNISPKSDGTIPEDQQAVLRAIGKWLRTNGEGVYGSASLQFPPNGGSEKSTPFMEDEKNGLRFTQKGDTVYAFVLRPKEGKIEIKSFGLNCGQRVEKVEMLGGSAVAFEQTPQGLLFNAALSPVDESFPVTYRITFTNQNPSPRSGGAGGGLRVLYIGDSITDGGWGRSGGSMKSSEERNHSDLNHIFGHGYMEMSSATLMAEEPGRYECFNRGISGNTLADLEQRWQSDCLSLNPDVISILIGTNDVEEFLNSGKKEFDIKEWENRYDALLTKTEQALNQKLKTKNQKLKLMLGTPFVAKVGKRGAAENFALRDSLVRECAAAVERLAKKHNATLVPFAKMIDELITPLPLGGGAGGGASLWIWDGIHPTSACHKKMADLWLEKFHILK